MNRIRIFLADTVEPLEYTATDHDPLIEALKQDGNGWHIVRGSHGEAHIRRENIRAIIITREAEQP